MRRFLLPMLLVFIVGTIIGSVMRINLVLGIVALIGLIVLLLAYPIYVYYWGDRLVMLGQMQRAIDHYTRVLRLPIVNNVVIQHKRGSVYQMIGEPEAALRDYDAVLAQRPDHGPTLAIRGALHVSLRDYHAAIRDSDRLLELYPDVEIGYANRAMARKLLGDWEGAIQDCNAGLERAEHPVSKTLLYNTRGTVHRWQGNLDAALGDYNLALNIATSSQEMHGTAPDIYTNQAAVYFLLGDMEQAQGLYDHAYSLAPELPAALAGRAVIQHQAGDHEAAVRIWRELLALDARFADPDWAWVELGWQRSSRMVKAAEPILAAARSD